MMSVRLACSTADGDHRQRVMVVFHFKHDSFISTTSELSRRSTVKSVVGAIDKHHSGESAVCRCVCLSVCVVMSV